MNLQIPGVAPNSDDDLEPGTFFAFARDKWIFALSVMNGQSKSALVFDKHPDRSVPWLTQNGLPSGSIAKLPGCILRAEWSDASEDEGQLPYGAIVSADENFYMRAWDGAGRSAIFNVASGLSERPKSDSPKLVYKRWKAGVVIDDSFQPIFEFPGSNAASVRTGTLRS